MAKRKGPKWTIMVYLAGDNNLTSNCISVLQQLEQVQYKGEEVCVLACFDSNTPAPKGSRYLAINCKRKKTDNGFEWEIHNDMISPAERGPAHVLKTPDFCKLKLNGNERSPASTRLVVAEGLKRFVSWAVKNHRESDRYMLILYGHGPVVAGQNFLAKENPPSSLRLEDLRRVLSSHFGRHRRQKIDIVAFQNCVMNGIETAYELKDHAQFMIGSQGLVLAHGWPYQKMIQEVVDNADAETKDIARKLLRHCARHMLDFAVMDRSSEQSLCDLSFLQDSNNMTNAIRGLVNALRRGMAFNLKRDKAVLRYPHICNAIKLARLEAQSYWGETFVDLYDFCERLIRRCKELDDIKKDFLTDFKLKDEEARVPKKFLVLTQQLRDIIRCCIRVQTEVKRMVPEKDSFYIGSELQYSHGLSIYFPWTLPGAPFFFKPRGTNGNGFTLKTAFETYRGYNFVEASRWALFLSDFFRATLRNVRRSPRSFALKADSGLNLGLNETVHAPSEVITINLQKSSSDTGKVDHEVWSNVKNYPRRNYLSPSDCPRKILEAGCCPVTRKSPQVSYMGWNIAGVVADSIRVQPAKSGKTVVAQSVVATAANGKRNGKAAVPSTPKRIMGRGKTASSNGTPSTNGHAKRNGSVVVAEKARQKAFAATSR